MKYIIEEIESVEQLENFDNEYVYDIEVDDNTHTFIANDILVHNSVYTTTSRKNIISNGNMNTKVIRITFRLHEDLINGNKLSQI